MLIVDFYKKENIDFKILIIYIEKLEWYNFLLGRFWKGVFFRYSFDFFWKISI